ncbi:hypothetical protein LIER_39647 [Lithospermum erythrorhizon]|uniref:Uncharacterized protein n=1 Tax=Lithospermum erythrorhizon TaxID=34254 RepID=A0AAV3QKN3_LITER
MNSGVDFDHGNDMMDMLREGRSYPVDETLNSNESGGPNDDTKKFFRLMEEVEVELYPGCKKISKLSVIVRLLQEKSLHKIFVMLESGWHLMGLTHIEI